MACFCERKNSQKSSRSRPLLIRDEELVIRVLDAEALAAESLFAKRFHVVLEARHVRLLTRYF